MQADGNLNTGEHEVGINKGEGVISSNKQRELEASINNFKKWLRERKKLCLDAAEQYTRLTFPKPTEADWTMIAEGSEVKFNTFLTSKCTFDFYRMVVLHECFHLFVQHVPNKCDAKRVKDSFGDAFMKLLDIEADYYTAMYYKEVERASVVDIFSLLYEGSKTFRDSWIRPGKVERFIGTILSIAKAYFRNPRAKWTREKELFLPDISNISMENRINILVQKGNHFCAGEINVDNSDLDNIRKCYRQADTMGVQSYVESLLQFASKALDINIPPVIYKQVHDLEEPASPQLAPRPCQSLLLYQSAVAVE